MGERVTQLKAVQAPEPMMPSPVQFAIMEIGAAGVRLDHAEMKLNRLWETISDSNNGVVPVDVDELIDDVMNAVLAARDSDIGQAIRHLTSHHDQS